uniref:CSON000783 protein n=1 Tax=Culicoides sonorensis TaxID=179676 RepID=A0A336MFR6_CULSO
MSLARRRNRYSYLIKLSGAFGLASALTCALVTVTTTVLHMSRLQSLRECDYQVKTRTCTCYTQPQADNLVTEDPGVRFVFDSTADCGVVHGALYSCLRAVFGLSVAGVLVAVFSCMLVYQLLSHERKKMYWEQLELRCRSLYSTQPPPSVSTVGPIIGTPRNTACRCCEQCHAHRNALATATYPWEPESRFWIPGQAGNFYSPNPGSDDMTQGPRQLQGRNTNNTGNRGPGWSWPRMPWQRANDQRGFRQTPSSPDSQYGFSNNSVPDGANATAMTTVQSNYTLINAPYGVWGPPPPYSDPNSPARRMNNNGRYQYISSVPMQAMQPTTVVIQGEMQVANVQNVQTIEHHQRAVETPPITYSPSAQAQLLAAVPQMRKQRQQQAIKYNKDSSNFENTQSDSDGPSRDKFSNTLPVRKVKKRHIDYNQGGKSIGAGANNVTQQRVTVQEIFRNQTTVVEHEYNEPSVVVNAPGTSTRPDTQQHDEQNINVRHSRRSKMTSKGVENTGFQEHAQNPGQESDHCKQGQEPAESEVYFGDVSSCCNISVQNDNFYDDSSSNGGHRNKRSTPNTSSSDKSFSKEDDDYLAQRFGKREPSVRSRLPFPQIPEIYDPSPVVSPRASLIPKDISRQSMCSVDSSTGDKTDYTDLSPATPINPPYTVNNEPSPFVASIPYSSNDQSQEAHKRLTKNLQDVFLNTEINGKTSSDTSPLTMITYDHSSGPSPTFNYAGGQQSSASSSMRSPKNFNVNLTPKSRSSYRSNDATPIKHSEKLTSSPSDCWQDQHDRRL